MRHFSGLSDKINDNYIIGELFDIVIKEIYGEIELTSNKTCTFDMIGGHFICVYEVKAVDGDLLHLHIDDTFCISCWCNYIPLHFNQFPLYKRLAELGFIDLKAGD